MAKVLLEMLAPPVQAFPKALWPSHGSHRFSLLALFLHRTHVRGVMLFRNAKMRRETDLGLCKTPSRRTKPIKIFWKRQNEAGNRSKSPKSHFLRRETGKILRKVISRGGKGEKCFGKRLRAAGRRLKVSEIGFVRRERGRMPYALRTFPMETISRILINRIGTGCLKCPPLLSPLRCIWGVSITPLPLQVHSFWTELNGAPRKRFVIFLWHLSSGRM